MTDRTAGRPARPPARRRHWKSADKRASSRAGRDERCGGDRPRGVRVRVRSAVLGGWGWVSRWTAGRGFLISGNQISRQPRYIGTYLIVVFCRIIHTLHHIILCTYVRIIYGHTHLYAHTYTPDVPTNKSLTFCPRIRQKKHPNGFAAVFTDGCFYTLYAFLYVPRILHRSTRLLYVIDPESRAEGTHMIMLALEKAL